VACLHEIAIARCAPVSIRLVDNPQFQFGLALKPPTDDWKHAMIDKVKKWFVALTRCTHTLLPLNRLQVDLLPTILAYFNGVLFVLLLAIVCCHVGM
jgi:hypothetical protein